MVDKKYYLIKDNTLYFSDSVLEVDGTDFQCKSLMDVKLSQRTTRLSESVFEGNYLRSITFYKKVKVIESRAFANNRIEKIVFNRVEIPAIAMDAFVGNPVKLIIVPYESLDVYKKLLSRCQFDTKPQIISNIELKFAQLEVNDTDNEVIVVNAYSIYGEYLWRIESIEKTDLEASFLRDQNPQNFTTRCLDNGKTYHIHRKSHGDVTIYSLINGVYVDLTMQDFKELFEEKDILC